MPYSKRVPYMFNMYFMFYYTYIKYLNNNLFQIYEYGKKIKQIRIT